MGESMGMWGAGGSSAGSGHGAIVLRPSLEALARLPEGCRHAPQGLLVQAVTHFRPRSPKTPGPLAGLTRACGERVGAPFGETCPGGGRARGAQPAAGARRPHARPAPPGRSPAARAAGRGESEPRALRAVRSPAGPGLSRPPALPQHNHREQRRRRGAGAGAEA